MLGDGVDIRIIQLVLGHSDIKTTQRYLNITDEELRKTLTSVSEDRRQLKAVGASCQSALSCTADRSEHQQGEGAKRPSPRARSGDGAPRVRV